MGHIALAKNEKVRLRSFPGLRTLGRQLPLFAAAGAILVLANLAPGVLQLGSPSDKLNHMLAFAVLTPLALIAFPRASALWVFVGLALFNAAIELSQAVLGQGREPDPLDWIAGVLATIPILAVVGGYRLFCRGR